MVGYSARLTIRIINQFQLFIRDPNNPTRILLSGNRSRSPRSHYDTWSEEEWSSATERVLFCIVSWETLATVLSSLSLLCGHLYRCNVGYEPLSLLLSINYVTHPPKDMLIKYPACGFPAFSLAKVLGSLGQKEKAYQIFCKFIEEYGGKTTDLISVASALGNDQQHAVILSVFSTLQISEQLGMPEAAEEFCPDARNADRFQLLHYEAQRHLTSLSSNMHTFHDSYITSVMLDQYVALVGLGEFSPAFWK